MPIEFDMPKIESSIIKVLGVGGGGSNAVNHMFNQGIKGVDFVICNTDAQALEQSPVPNKIQLGSNLTEGRGAGSNPEVGKKAALEDLEALKKILSNNTKMLFITAGMGGGTGTGAAPIIAQASQELGILTVGIVTTPFKFEGKRRQERALEGIEELSKTVDTLLIISNEKLRELSGNIALSTAFSNADNILTTAAKGIAEIITVPGYINVDFEDVKTVMSNSGAAIMGSAMAEGDNRALKAVEQAIHSPLISGNSIRGAKYILLNISSGSKEVTMDEITEITDFITDESDSDVDVIWGNCIDENLGDNISVTIIATAFESPKEQVKEEINRLQQNRSRQISLFNESSREDTYENQTEETLTEETTKQKADQEPISENEDVELKHQEDSQKEEETEKEPYVEERQQEVTKANEVDSERERLRRLSSGNFDANKADLDEMEKVPAYIRKNIKLTEVPESDEENISRYSLEESSGKERPEIRRNNSFLHDNVD